MKLSIIIPVFNVASYLEQCISSIFAQKLDTSDYEILLINDGSTDESGEICDNLAIKYHNIKAFHQQNAGQSIARNLGLLKSKGEYIYFIDSDDYLTKGYLYQLLDQIEQNHLDFIGFGVRRTSERVYNEIKIKEISLDIIGDGINIISKFNFNNGPWWYIFKKSILQDLKFEEGRLCEDGLFTAQLLLRVKNGGITETVIYNYFVNHSSTVHIQNNSKQFLKLNEDMFFAARKFNFIISELPIKDKYYSSAFKRLKDRQESYTFFGMVRFIRSQRKYNELKGYLINLSSLKYPAYPIKVFDGYRIKKNKVLIAIFNNKLLLYILVGFNRIFRIIK
ncbi:glycosyltransferase family 2 protein [Daejeonia sp. YH14]|uniref:glycosyltransferase family 2 protein n=1 Tax=Daejeonia sp. YH14 TaxID=3439042 RepID=UPI003F4951CD